MNLTCNRSHFVSFIVIATLLVSIAGCDGASTQTNATTAANAGIKRLGEGPYTIIATTAMVADVVKHVVGDRAVVHPLMHAGVDPHMYRASRSDITAMLEADVVFYNGLNLEGKMSDSFVRVATSGKPVFAITELLDEQYLLSPEDFEGYFDPHVWMDPIGWARAAEVVVAKMAELDPAHAETYRNNGQAYIFELKQLDAYAKESLSTVPADRRVLVTAHDAFNYFARAYNMEVLGIQGISTDSQAGMRQIESLIDLLVTRKVPAVFTESTVSDKSVLALVEGAKARSHIVRIGGELFSDAMGTEGTYEGTYIGMIDHNITTIVRALGGTAPEKGMSGKLQ